MATLITDVKVILTAPESINLIVVKVETNQDGLYGERCYRTAMCRPPLLRSRDAGRYLDDYLQRPV